MKNMKNIFEYEKYFHSIVHSRGTGSHDTGVQVGVHKYNEEIQ